MALGCPREAAALSPAIKVRVGGDYWHQVVAVGLPGPQALSPHAMWPCIVQSKDLTPGIATTAMKIAEMDKKARAAPDAGGLSKDEATKALLACFPRCTRERRNACKTPPRLRSLLSRPRGLTRGPVWLQRSARESSPRRVCSVGVSRTGMVTQFSVIHAFFNVRFAVGLILSRFPQGVGRWMHPVAARIGFLL